MADPGHEERMKPGFCRSLHLECYVPHSPRHKYLVSSWFHWGGLGAAAYLAGGSVLLGVGFEIKSLRLLPDHILLHVLI